MAKVAVTKPKRLLRKGMGNTKGGAFERDVAIKLSLWLTKGANHSLFSRNRGSGGAYTRATARGGRIDEAGIPGDLASVYPQAYEFIRCFNVECKHYGDLWFTAFLMDLKGKSFLTQTIAHTRTQAEEGNKEWMVIAKENRIDTLLFMSQRIGSIAIECVPFTGMVKYHSLFEESIFMMRFETFIRCVKSDMFLSRVHRELFG
jgi:hypothetical protein